MVSSTDVKTDTHLRVLSTSKMTNIPPKQFVCLLASLLNVSTESYKFLSKMFYGT